MYDVHNKIVRLTVSMRVWVGWRCFYTYVTERFGVHNSSGVDGEHGEDAVSAAADEHRRATITDTTTAGHVEESDAARHTAQERTLPSGQVARF